MIEEKLADLQYEAVNVQVVIQGKADGSTLMVTE